MFRFVNNVLSFALESTLLFAFCYFTFQKVETGLARFALTVLLPAVAIFCWGYLAAPQSAHRLRLPYLAACRGVLFLSASYCLYRCHKTSVAILVALLSLAIQLISVLSGED